MAGDSVRPKSSSAFSSKCPFAKLSLDEWEVGRGLVQPKLSPSKFVRVSWPTEIVKCQLLKGKLV